MSTYTGLDMAPSAMRWFVRDDAVNAGESGGPVFGIRGCPRHPDYDSAVSWSDAMAFRKGEFDASYDSGVEKTVAYELPNGRASEWLRSLFRSTGGHPAEDVNGTMAVAVPDHASPDERDEVLSGLSSTKYANVSLVWRPVAGLLAWMNRQGEDDLQNLVGKRLFVLDLDAGRPEITELKCVRHRVMTDWIVPSRSQPLKTTVAQDDAFERSCYRSVLDGVDEWEQLLGGQFYSGLQEAIESGASEYEAWVRKKGSWTSRSVSFNEDLPQEVLRELNPVIASVWKKLTGDDIVLINGWVARKYRRQICDALGRKCGHIDVLAAEDVSRGSALFAERLAKGLPTYYDRIGEYQFWDGFRLRFVPMFSSAVEVEPGKKYRYPEAGQEPRRLRVEKFTDNVSFYIRETSSREYARRIKTDFVEFLRSDLQLDLSAVVSPEKGSARFELSMCDPKARAIFVSGKNTVRNIVLRWSSGLNTNKSVAVDLIEEHQGYVEPQPVLGRIYDSEDNLRMVEEYVKNPRGAAFQSLWKTYAAAFRPRAENGIADRVGYHARPAEPTRGLFGTRYVFNARVDEATHAFAKKCADEHPFANLQKEGMLRQNYCHSGALADYKNLIRSSLRKRVTPQFNFSFYNAAGYVLGEDPEDVAILLNYICSTTHLQAERGKLWWSFFRMLCWHPNCKLTVQLLPLLEQALDILCDQDANKIVCGGKWAANDVKYLPLAILYSLRIRECGEDLSPQLIDRLAGLLSNDILSNVQFPQTMIPKVDQASRLAGDTLSKYVLRFLKRQDTLADRELGAAMGGV